MATATPLGNLLASPSQPVTYAGMRGPGNRAAGQGVGWKVRTGGVGTDRYDLEEDVTEARTKAALGWAGWEAEEVRRWKFLSWTVDCEEDSVYQAGLARQQCRTGPPRPLCS